MVHFWFVISVATSTLSFEPPLPLRCFTLTRPLVLFVTCVTCKPLDTMSSVGLGTVLSA
ncbi:hypothetical protein M758_12G127200 [Ceratodon purpureus]|nr:hypothetical protein M758_12G127200 [Ceratodon purpureus]